MAVERVIMCFKKQMHSYIGIKGCILFDVDGQQSDYVVTQCQKLAVII